MYLRNKGIITEPVPGLSREAVYTLDQAVVQNFLKEEGRSRERAPVLKPRPRKENPEVKK